jgi:hypothetical protein
MLSSLCWNYRVLIAHVRRQKRVPTTFDAYNKNEPTTNLKHVSEQCTPETCWMLWNLLMVAWPSELQALLPHRKELTKFQGISWWPLVDAVRMGVALLAIGNNTWNWLAIIDCTRTATNKKNFGYKTGWQNQNGVRHPALFSIAPLHSQNKP